MSRVKLETHQKSSRSMEKHLFRGMLYSAFREETKLDSESFIRFTFFRLLRSIQSGKFRPFFNREEIDALFRDEILKTLASGRYLSGVKLDSIDKWCDLINTIGSSFQSNLRLLKRGTDLATRMEITKDNQAILRQLKLIEDWLYHHPEEQMRLVALL